MKFLHLVILLLAPLVHGQIVDRINTAGYPADFQWGAATAAYQVEGAFDEDGRTPSIWDTFSHVPGNIYNDDNADVTDDFYHHYREDIQLMKTLGLTSFRFSISWSRLLVDGTDEVNQLGADFYSNLTDELLANDIEPFVTLYHWDLPQALQDNYGGWVSREDIVRDFGVYARTAFDLLGDRVKSWLTFNEPAVFIGGYRGTGFAPGVPTDQAAFEIPQTIVLAHAHAVDIYRTEFQADQGGKIGITLNVNWNEPLVADSRDDQAASERSMLQSLGFWFDPIFFGDYSDELKEFWGDKLLPFSDEESALLKGSYDFFGLNSYSASYATDDPDCDHDQDPCVRTLSADTDGVPIGARSAQFTVVPWGMRRLLNYIADRYDSPAIFITENGFGDSDVPQSLGLEPVNNVQLGVVDPARTLQIIDTLEAVRSAIVDDGVNVVGYFHWSLMDNFEWAQGFSRRFGLLYVDYTDDDRPRFTKNSYDFYQAYIASAKVHTGERPPDRIDSVEGSTMNQGLLISTIAFAVLFVIATSLWLHERTRGRRADKARHFRGSQAPLIPDDALNTVGSELVRPHA